MAEVDDGAGPSECGLFPLRSGADGSHPRTVGIADDSHLFLLVSLSEPFEHTDNCYKLVAGTLEVPAPWFFGNPRARARRAGAVLAGVPGSRVQI